MKKRKKDNDWRGMLWWGSQKSKRLEKIKKNPENPNKGFLTRHFKTLSDKCKN